MKYEMLPLGDSGILIRLGDRLNEETHAKVTETVRRLEHSVIDGVVELVPAIASVAVHYDPVQVWRGRTVAEARLASPYETICSRVGSALDRSSGLVDSAQEVRTVHIPVCYGGEYGPDLAEVARHAGLTEEEVVSLHSGGDYTVYMIGFAPGFPYLGGMPERIAAPRRDTPRTVIPAGSVGIAGLQTGIYPIATPGGWQLIGRTPAKLFDPGQHPPSLLRAGDKVKFVPIAHEQLEGWRLED